MATLTLTVAASADDGFLRQGSSWTDTNTNDPWGGVGTAPPTDYGVGVRFTGVTLSAGDTVTAAYLSLMKEGTQWQQEDHRFSVIDEDNTATFSAGSPPGVRAIVAASIAAYTANVNQTDGTRYNYPPGSPEQATLGAAIEAVTNRGGWASGNALAVVDNSDQDASAYQTFATKSFRTYDYGTPATNAPQLVITYTPSGTVSASQLSATVSVTPLAIPTYVAAGTASFTATNAATLAPGLPAGWQADDIHILLAARSDNTAMTDLSGSGWTQIAALSGNNTAALRVEVWWRRAVGGDAAPTVTFGSGTVVRGARIYGIRGCPTTGDPFATPSRSDNAASATVSTSNITPSVPSLGLFLYAYEDDPTAASTVTGWGAFAITTSTLGNDMALGAATHTFIFGQSYGTPSTTVSGGTFANSVNVGILLPMIAPADVTVNAAHLDLTSSLHTATAAGETGGGAATVNAALLAATSSLPAATVTAEQTATITPGLLTATASLPTATVTASTTATVTPSLQTATLSLQAPTVSATQTATATPSLLTATASLHAPTVSTSGAVTVTPGLLTTTASLSASAVSGAASVAPSLQTETLTLFSATASAVRTATITPSLLTATASLGSATVSAGGNITLSPAMLTASVSLHSATVTAVRTATATPALLTATLTLFAATASATSTATVSPTTRVATLSLHTPTVSTSGAVTVGAALQSAAVSLHTPTVAAGGSVTLTPALLSLAASLPAASVSVSDTAESALLAVAMTLHQPSLSTVRHVTATPAALALALVLPTATAGFVPTKVAGRVRVGARRAGDSGAGARPVGNSGAGARQAGGVAVGSAA